MHIEKKYFPLQSRYIRDFKMGLVQHTQFSMYKHLTGLLKLFSFHLYLVRILHSSWNDCENPNKSKTCTSDESYTLPAVETLRAFCWISIRFLGLTKQCLFLSKGQRSCFVFAFLRKRKGRRIFSPKNLFHHLKAEQFSTNPHKEKKKKKKCLQLVGACYSADNRSSVDAYTNMP